MTDHRSPTGLTESDVRTHLDSTAMDELLHAIVHSHTPTPARRSHRKAWALSAGAVLALGSTAAIAAVTLSPQQRESAAFDCNLSALASGAAGGGVIGPVTGDPVVDCANEYHRVSGLTAPPLIAYSSGIGGIEVLPASVTPPADYKALPSGTTLDLEKTLLDETLGDVVAGLNTTCLDQAQAVTRSEQIVAALGYADWRVAVDPPVGLPDGTCWVAGARGSDKTVRVARLGGLDPQNDTQIRAFAKPLRASATNCWDRTTALAQIRDAATAVGIKESAIVVNTIDDATARCSTIHVTGGGLVFVVVRGPAT